MVGFVRSGTSRKNLVDNPDNSVHRGEKPVVGRARSILLLHGQRAKAITEERPMFPILLENGTRVEIIRINTRLAGSILFVNPVNQSRSLGGFIAATTIARDSRREVFPIGTPLILDYFHGLPGRRFTDTVFKVLREVYEMVKKEKERRLLVFSKPIDEIDLLFGSRPLRRHGPSLLDRSNWKWSDGNKSGDLFRE